MTSGAIISDCGLYRYLLWRSWTPHPGGDFMTWIMLNPSTADHRQDDPTIRKCVKFAKAWGYDGIYVVNLFAYRATDPKELKKLDYAQAVGPLNDEYIIKAVEKTGLTIKAWGQNGKLYNRASAIGATLKVFGLNNKLTALRLAKDGTTPWHPLYLPDSSRPLIWNEK